MPAADLAAAPRANERDGDDLALLRDVAEAGAALAMRFWRNDPEQWSKEGGSPVSEADIAVDALLRERLLDARPDYGWLSEEASEADRTRMEGRRGFIADPIDGTRAYLEGKETWGVAVAVVENGRPRAGGLACPALGLLYAARAGGGATRNGEPIRANAAAARPRMAGPKGWMSRMPDGYAERVQRVPYIPTLAYRIALVADGGLDGTFVRASAHDWDLAASDVILEEAGGRLLRGDGEPPLYGRDTTRHGLLVAGSAVQLPQMLDMVRRTRD